MMSKEIKKANTTDITPIIRESKRAKNVSLKMSLQGDLTVVIPQGFDQSLIPDILHKKQFWIKKVQHQIEKQRKFSKSESPAQIPERISLRAIGQEWSVGYKMTTDSWVSAEERNLGDLLIYGNIDNYPLCIKMLQHWLSYHARKHLVPWLNIVSDELGLPLNRATVRNQRTRWASCSQHKSISINQKLLFFPPHLVRYIFIHELCHTVQMNH